MIDEGYHPMTMYFPLVVHGAMLIEPTESESKASLDLFIMSLARSRDGGQARRARTLRRAASGAAPAARRDAGGADAGAALGEGGGGRRSKRHGWRLTRAPGDVWRGRSRKGLRVSNSPLPVRHFHAAQSVLGGVAEGPVIATSEPLSFWGGVDAATGRVITSPPAARRFAQRRHSADADEPGIVLGVGRFAGTGVERTRARGSAVLRSRRRADARRAGRFGNVRETAAGFAARRRSLPGALASADAPHRRLISGDGVALPLEGGGGGGLGGLWCWRRGRWDW